MRRSVLVAALLASVACQRTPAQSQTTQPAKPGATGQPTPGQPAGQAGAPGQPATPGQPGAPGAPGEKPEAPPVKPVPAQLPEVLARVGTETVSKTEFERAVRTIEARAKRPVPIEQRDQIYRRILDQLIDVDLITLEGRSRNIVVSDADVDAQIGKMRGQFKTEEEFTKQLAEQKITLPELKQEMQREMLVSKTLEAEVLPKVNVAQTDLDTFYKENQDQFKQPEQIRASHILIDMKPEATELQKKEARALADGLLKRARGGEDFAALAKQYSKDSSAQAGGDLNFFGRGQMVPAFDTAAFALQPGQVSDIVETPFGLHIIKLAEKKPERVVPLAEVSEKLTNFLKQRKQQEVAGQFVQSLRTKYKVDILI